MNQRHHNGSRAREPRLTKEQLTAWAGLTAAAWAPFKEAWMGRGLLLPPAGRQRELLWEIADARPTDLARWVRDAPAPAEPRRIIDYVLARWHDLRRSLDEALNEEDARLLAERADNDAAAKRAMTRIGEVLRG